MVQKVGRRLGEQFCGKKWFRECEFSNDEVRETILDFHNSFGISLHAWRMVQKVGRRVGEQFWGKKWFRECHLSSDGARKANLDLHNWFVISLHAQSSKQLIQNSVRVFATKSLRCTSMVMLKKPI